MRFKITLRSTKSKTSLPINYNYFLTGLIYRTLEKSSEDTVLITMGLIPRSLLRGSSFEPLGVLKWIC